MMYRLYDKVDAAYAAACSNITVCSNSKGFFNKLSEDLVELASADGWLQAFEKVEEGKKVAAVMENKKIIEALSDVFSRIQPLRRGKDANISQERRLDAQKALENGDLTKALGLASQAVLRAPMTGENEKIDNGVTLAMALWVRSEVLLEINRPAAALEDLKLALKERLPAKMRPQYYWRMGHCYRGVGEPTRAKVSYELASRLLGKDENAKSKLEKDIKSLDFNMEPRPSPDKHCITVTGKAKQSMPALSDLVKIVEEENKGRFAVANTSVKSGDVLLVDEPYAACLLPDKYGTHCLHCFKRLEDNTEEAPMWCPTCSGVVFCSITCRDVAVSTYHCYECPFLDLFIGSGMSILSHIALRMLTQAGIDTSLSIHSKYLSNQVKTLEGTILNDIEGAAKKSKIKSRKGRSNRTKRNAKNSIEKDLKNDKSDMKPEKVSLEENLELKAAQIYSLCFHGDQRRGDDYLKRVLMAMFLFACLKKTDFLGKHAKNQNVEQAVCELLARNLQLLQFNAHEIYETICGRHQFNGSKPLYIAVGVYPTGALFNHECYPAVARYFEGQKIVLRAIRPLKPGEMVSENYGPNFLMRSYVERQRALACRYWFKCECIACKQDWPTLKMMSSETPLYFSCSNLSCSWIFRANLHNLPKSCPECANVVDKQLVEVKLATVNKCISLYKHAATLMEDENKDDASVTLCRAIDLFHSAAEPPHRETHIAQEALRSCFAAEGNIHIVTNGDQALEGSKTRDLDVE